MPRKSKPKSADGRWLPRRIVRPLIVDGACIGATIDGQQFRYVRTGFYQSPTTGNVSEVDYWSTDCLGCREPLECFTKSDDQRHFYPARRCSACANKHNEYE